MKGYGVRRTVLIMLGVTLLGCLGAARALFAAPPVDLVRNFPRAEFFQRSGYVKDIAVLGDVVWYATANGLVSYDVGRDAWGVFHDGNSPLPANYVSKLAVDQGEGSLWMATAQGVARYRPAEQTPGLRWKVYTKRDGLADEETTSVAVDEEFVWVGTRYWGVIRFDKRQQIWRSAPYTPIDGLGANRIHALAVDGDQIWAGTDDGLSVYDRYADLWTTYDASQGLTAKQVTCVDSDGKNVWVGTYGGGLLRFDKDSMRFQAYRVRDGLADDTVFAVRSDGEHVWAGTFGGVSRLDRSAGGSEWTTITKASHGLLDNSVSAIALYGSQLFLGTDGEGGMMLDKKTPQVWVHPKTGYEKPGSILIQAGLRSTQPVVTAGASWRPSIYVTQPYSTAGLVLLGQEKIRGARSMGALDVARLDAGNLKEGLTYDLVFEITDASGFKNRAVWPLVIDATKPVITVDDAPETVKTREYTLRGRYLELYPREFEYAQNGGSFTRLQEVDRKMRTWKQTLNLVPGDNRIQVRILDIARQDAVATRSIFLDEQPPIIGLTPDRGALVSSEEKYVLKFPVADETLDEVYLMPGRIRGKLVQKEKGKWEFESTLSLARGVNKFQIVAVDKAGSRTTKDLTVTFNTEAPSLEFAVDMASESFSEFFTVKGTWDDKDLREIIVEPGSVPATIDRTKKTFEARIKLESGFNTVRAKAVDEQENARTLEFQVILRKSDEADPAALLRDSAENYRLYVEYRKKYEDLQEKYRQLLLQTEKLKNGEKLDQETGPWMPPGDALYHVAYNRAAGDSMESLAVRLYGNESAKGIIARYNSQASDRAALVVPTLSLVRLCLTVPERNALNAIVEASAVVMGSLGTGGSWWQFSAGFSGALAGRGGQAIAGENGMFLAPGNVPVLLHTGDWAGGVERIRRKRLALGVRSGYIVLFQGNWAQFIRVE